MDEKIKSRMLMGSVSGAIPKFRELIEPGSRLPRLPPRISPPLLPPSPPVLPPPPVAPPPPPVAVPPEIPPAPGTNPFTALPFRSPGDRIKSDDFNALSQSLKTIYDSSLLSSTLFGVTLGEAKLVLYSQKYEIQQVMSVFGAEIENLVDTSLDNRKVVQVITVLGERRVRVVVTEAVETRRFAPNLLGLTYWEGSERLKALLGEITFPTTPLNASQLVGLSLKEASQIVSKQ